jgi:hypothetical protein
VSEQVRAADAQRRQLRNDAERERRDEIEHNRQVENAARREAAEQQQAENRERRAAAEREAAEEDRAREAARTEKREADDARYEAARREVARAREAEAQKQATDRARQAAEARQREEVRLARLAEERARMAELEKEQQKAIRLAAEQALAERHKRPECREADRLVEEAGDTVRWMNGLGALLDIGTKFEAGMVVEACAVTRKTYTTVERLRSAMARCEPTEAIPFNQLATVLREAILEMGC